NDTAAQPRARREVEGPLAVVPRPDVDGEGRRRDPAGGRLDFVGTGREVDESNLALLSRRRTGELPSALAAPEPYRELLDRGPGFLVPRVDGDPPESAPRRLDVGREEGRHVDPLRGISSSRGIRRRAEPRDLPRICLGRDSAV